MKQFESIYKNKYWGKSRLYPGHGSSGLGSSVEYVAELIPWLCRYIAEHKISSFLDIGCGECEWQRVIDWEELNCQYIGIELSPDVATRVSSDLLARKNMSILQGDCTQMDLPTADLAFAKEIFQHWPIQLTNDFLEKLCQTSNHCVTYNCDISNSFLRYNIYRYFISKQLEVHDEVVNALIAKMKSIHWDTHLGGFRPCNFDVYGVRLATFKWKWHFPASLIRIDHVARDLTTQCYEFTDYKFFQQIDKITGGVYTDTDLFLNATDSVAVKEP